MKWNEILKQYDLANVKSRILGHKTSWSSFTDSEAMTEFIGRVLQSGNRRDVAFKRDCIDFVRSVFTSSSDPIRNCILSSHFMDGVYDLLSESGSHRGFEDIIEYSNHICEWHDIKSGLALLSQGRLSSEAFRTLSTRVSESDLANSVSSGQMTEKILDSFLCNTNKWRDWNRAVQIIDKYPDALRHNCFIDIASQQPDEKIYRLSVKKGVQKRYIRNVVLKKGKLRSWDNTLDYLAQDILLPSDTIFRNIAVQQSCEDLFNLYDGEFIGAEDLQFIIAQKEYWDDYDSIERLQQDGILILSKEQIILSALNRGRLQMVDLMIKDRKLLSRVLELWESKPILCPAFPSLCWISLDTAYIYGCVSTDCAEYDFTNQRAMLSAFKDETTLKTYLIKQYALQGGAFVTSLLGALSRGELFSKELTSYYKQITSSSKYLSLKEIAVFKQAFSADYHMLKAAEILGLFSYMGNPEFASIYVDLSLSERMFSQKYNSQFFNRINCHQQKYLGAFANSYRDLNKEQRHAVLNEEESSLVINVSSMKYN